MLVGPALYAFVYPSLIFMLLAATPLVVLPVVTYFYVPLAPFNNVEVTRANHAYRLIIAIFFIYLAYAAYDLSQSL